MEIQTTFLVALALAMDCFSVSLGVGGSPLPQTNRSILRLAFHFGLFQGLMALLGWLLGANLIQYIRQFDHWIAFGLLAWIGVRMILSGIKQDGCGARQDPTRGGTMVVLCVATSLDALAVGLSLGILEVNILSASLVIALVSFFMTIGGFMIGQGLNQRLGRWMEIFGGVLLILIGLRILIRDLFPGFPFS